MDSYYQKHIFICTNQKAEGKVCCANTGGEAFFKYFKQQLLEKGLHGPGLYRVSQAKCLGRCGTGPAIVVYPEGIWYTYASYSDIDAIIDQHFLKGVPVERLLMQVPNHLPG